MPEPKKVTAGKIEVKVASNTVIGSSYAQIATVFASNIDVTLDFIFLHPRDMTEGQVVSRVTMPIAEATQLAKILGEVTANATKHRSDNK